MPVSLSSSYFTASVGTSSMYAVTMAGASSPAPTGHPASTARTSGGESETRIAELTTRAAEAEARATAAEALARTTEINAQAMRLGFIDPKDAALLVGADVSLEGIGAALESVVESKSYLVAARPSAPTTATAPPRVVTDKPTFTQAQIADPKFWAANKDAIMLAMKEGRIAAN